MSTFDGSTATATQTDAIDRALEDLRAGKFVVLVGTADRLSEGTLTIAAEHCTAEAVGYMARHGGGIVSLCLTEERCNELGLGPMTRTNTSTYQAAFTVSVEAREGITTGISAADRARTIAVAVDPNSRPSDLVSPGHIFPLRAREGGVLARVAHTEGAVDLARLAGLTPAAVVCGILADDGSMADPAEIEDIAGRLGLPIVRVDEIVDRRRATEEWIDRAGERELETSSGVFTAHAVVERYTGLVHLALVKGTQTSGDAVFVHEECPAGDIFGARNCGCGEALQRTLDEIERVGSGMVVYVARPPDAARLREVVGPRCGQDANAPSAKAVALAQQIIALLKR